MSKAENGFLRVLSSVNIETPHLTCWVLEDEHTEKDLCVKSNHLASFGQCNRALENATSISFPCCCNKKLYIVIPQFSNVKQVDFISSFRRDWKADLLEPVVDDPFVQISPYDTTDSVNGLCNSAYVMSFGNMVTVVRYLALYRRGDSKV